MNNTDQNWKRLVRVAKHAPASSDAGAPFGFGTRVVARWLAGGRPQPSAWELLSLRSVGIALLVMLVSLGVNFNVVRDQFIPAADGSEELAALIPE